MGGLKDKLLKPLIIRSYRTKLRRFLVEKYGGLKRLTYPKIRDVIEERGLNTTYEAYAYAMYLKESQFKHFQKQTGYDDYSYTYLRIRLGLDPILGESYKDSGVGSGGFGDH